MSWKHKPILGGIVALCLALTGTAAGAALPNIVYVIADDLGYGDVHCLNPQRGKIPTPNCDRLAQQGMTFTDAHGGSSVCTPTRYGLLTGRYAWRTRLQAGVLGNYVEPLIAPDRLTVPALLKQHGYHSACIGKWHLGFTVQGGEDQGGEKRKRKAKGNFMGAPLGACTSDGPVSRGFDHYYGFHHARMMKSVFTDDRVTELVEPVDLLPKLTRHAVEYIESRVKSSAPFFLYFALSSPHTPIVPSKPWQGKSGLGDYGDFVMETDGALGEVLAAVDRAGIADNTLVIFTSDNGCSPAAGVENLQQQGHFPSAEFRGYKADIWEGGHRIPLLVRWPGVVKPGTSCSRLTCLTDLMATCADIVGAKLPERAGEDSVSILPLLKGGTQPVRDAVVHHSIHGRFAIRQGPWKLELCPGSGGWCRPHDAEALRQGLPKAQLYDVSADAGETKNRQAEQPETVARLRELLRRIVSEGRSTPGPPGKNDVDVVIESP